MIEVEIDENKLFEWCQRLVFHEGMSLKPYYCTTGKLTIGVGRNLEDNPLSPEEKKAIGNYMEGISKNGAMMLLRHDIKNCVGQLRHYVKDFDKLDVERQYALLDMCFQLGIKGLRKFKAMLKDFENGNFDMAAFECLHSQYAKQTPNRAKRIAYLIKFGVWKERFK